MLVGLYEYLLFLIVETALESIGSFFIRVIIALEAVKFVVFNNIVFILIQKIIYSNQ